MSSRPSLTWQGPRASRSKVARPFCRWRPRLSVASASGAKVGQGFVCIGVYLTCSFLVQVSICVCVLCFLLSSLQLASRLAVPPAGPAVGSCGVRRPRCLWVRWSLLLAAFSCNVVKKLLFWCRGSRIWILDSGWSTPTCGCVLTDR